MRFFTMKKLYTFLSILLIANISVAQNAGFADVLTVFQNNCVSCHQGATPSGNLNLKVDATNTATVIYNNLVNANASNATALAKGHKRVAAGDPYRSFLFRKINNQLAKHIDLESSEGDNMPVNATALSKRDRELIRQWIFAGAPQTGTPVSMTQVNAYYDVNGNITGTESMPDASIPNPPPAGTGFQLHVGPFFINANSEREIFYVHQLNLPDDIEIIKFQNHYSTRSHHLIIYRYPSDADGAGVAKGFRPNTSQPNNAVIGEATQQAGEIELPARTAFRWQKTNYLDLNSHYINATSSVMAAEAYVNVYTQPMGTAVQEMFSQLMTNVNLVIPSSSSVQTFSKNETWSGNRYFWAMTSHTHARGVDFNVYRRDTNEQIFDAECSPSGTPGAADCIAGNYDYAHPPTRYWPNFLKLSGSTGLKQEAKYLNTTGSLITFGLQSTNEMMITMPMWVNDTTGLLLGSVTGLHSPTTQNTLVKAFPNPANNQVRLITQALNDARNLQIVLTDISGKQVMQQCLERNQDYIDIDLTSLTAGVYIYQVRYNNGESTTGKFVKQ